MDGGEDGEEGEPDPEEDVDEHDARHPSELERGRTILSDALDQCFLHDDGQADLKEGYGGHEADDRHEEEGSQPNSERKRDRVQKLHLDQGALLVVEELEDDEGVGDDDEHHGQQVGAPIAYLFDHVDDAE